MPGIKRRHLVELLKKGLKKEGMTFKFVGSSMSPTLKPGYSVTIKNVSRLNAGDIAVFNDKTRLVCHRLIYFHRDKYYLKGDAKSFPDRVVSKHEILGKVLNAKDERGRKIPLSMLKPKRFFLTKPYVFLYFLFKKYFSGDDFDNGH